MMISTQYLICNQKNSQEVFSIGQIQGPKVKFLEVNVAIGRVCGSSSLI